MPPVSYMYVTLRADNGMAVSALRGQESPRLTTGWGGWEITDRPKRVGATNWKGRDPFRMVLPLLFDEWIGRGIVESSLAQLEAMAGSPGRRPPVITDISGLVPRRDLDWVIESLEYGTDVIYSSSGRQRQDVIVNLLQYMKDVRVGENPSTPGTAPATRVVKPGDTLQKMAYQYYGSSDDWPKIADANNIRDPSNITSGQVIRLP